MKYITYLRTSTNSETADKINFGETSEFGGFGGKSADSTKNQRIRRKISGFSDTSKFFLKIKIRKVRVNFFCKAAGTPIY
jgi:hypothetical protein